MKIVASKALPSQQELVEILQKKFGDRYSCKLFGWGNHKTVMVRQSPFVSAQITLDNNEITVHGMSSPILTIIGLTELAVVFLFFMGWLYRKPWANLEKEVAVFLHQQYK